MGTPASRGLLLRGVGGSRSSFVLPFTQGNVKVGFDLPYDQLGPAATRSFELRYDVQGPIGASFGMPFNQQGDLLWSFGLPYDQLDAAVGVDDLGNTLVPSLGAPAQYGGPLIPGSMAIFNHAGKRLGAITGWSVTAPRSYKFNEVEDSSFFLPRNDYDVGILTGGTAPTFVDSRTASGGAGSITLADPVGTAVGDLLVVHVAYNRNWLSGNVPAPAGWTKQAQNSGRVCDWQPPGTGRAPGDYGLATFTRFVKAGAPSTRNFVSSGGLGIVGVIEAWRNVSAVGGASTATQGSTSTGHACRAPAAPEDNTVLLFAFGYDRSVTSVATDGSTERADLARSDCALAAYSRTQAAADATPSAGGATSSSAASAVAQGLALLPTTGPATLLRNDNFIYLDSAEPGIPAWAGQITNVKDANGGAEVQVLGMASLFDGLSTDQIQQEEQRTSGIARRLVLAAAAKQASHGDLVVDFESASIDNAPFLGVYSYSGNILRGLQGLADQTISEFYMASWIDRDDRLRTKLVWRKRRSIDHTGGHLKSGAALVLKDGTGGNITPGTEFNFSGAQRVNYARLTGTSTTFEQFLNYPSVQNVLQNATPVAVVNLPKSDMPGARRRERIDLSVPWGLSRERQRAMARRIEAKYLSYYFTFLQAYHARFGMPFVEGFDWAGPQSGADQIQMGAEWHRTYARLALVGDRTLAFAAAADKDADVTLEGWHFKDEIVVSNQRGVAIDYDSPTHRWGLRNTYGSMNDAVLSFRLDNFAVVDGSAFKVALTGEDAIDIATDATDPNSMWVLTWRSGASIVRKWDLVSRRPLLEWTGAVPSGRKLSGIDVDAVNGYLWGTEDSHADVVQLDLATGKLLNSFTTNLPSLVGISISGGIGYCAGSGGKIEMRHLNPDANTTTIGAYAGSYTAHGPLVGILVDPRFTEVWLLKSDRTRIFSASVAIAVTGQGGPADGAPGFPKIASGQYVRIVMVDSRHNWGGPKMIDWNDLHGKPPPAGSSQRAAAAGLQTINTAAQHASPPPSPMIHVCQFGRYVNDVWQDWPALTWPPGPPGYGKTRVYNGANCTMAAGSMLLYRHTGGTVFKTPVEMRLASGDTDFDGHIGSNPPDVAKAWKKLGYHLGYTQHGKWSDLIHHLMEGRGVYVAGRYHLLSGRYRCPNRDDPWMLHAMYIHRIRPDGKMEVHDPICRLHPKAIPQSVVRFYAEHMFSDTKRNAVQYAWSRVSTAGTIDRGGSGYGVWSRGKWTDTYQSNGIGLPASLVRTWDAGDPASGWFKNQKSISPVDLPVPASPSKLPNPDKDHADYTPLIILGEEGRVDDWDPATMGYGAYGQHFSRTQDAHTIQGTGWYLKPWDVPLSEFDIGEPDWPEGEAYAQDFLDRLNNQQGTQVLGLVNIDGVWGKIERGGLYAAQSVLQGPYPDGISGNIRVVGFSPDENSGEMQLLCEWVG